MSKKKIIPAAPPENVVAPEVTASAEIVHAIKGFGLDWKCSGFQFEVGKSYTHKGPVKAGSGGFHAIEGHPLEVFNYYAPGHSKYAETQHGGNIDRHSDDSKIASATITIGVELTIPLLVERAVKWVIAHCSPADAKHAEGDQSAASSTGARSAAMSTGYRSAASSTGYQSAASSTGDQSAASSTGARSAASSTGAGSAAMSTGYRSAAMSTGYRSAALSTGYRSAAMSTGYRSAASSTGDQSAASSTGDRSAASSTGYQSAASSTGDQSAAMSTGYRSAASSTGYQSAASSTGDQSAASSTGARSAASSSGVAGRAMGATGCALFLVYRDPYSREIQHAWAGIVGRDGIEPLTWYSLNETGKPQVAA